MAGKEFGTNPDCGAFRRTLRFRRIDHVIPVTAQPPQSLDERRQKLIDQLTQASGTVFDKTFGRIQAEVHREALALFQSYAANGDTLQIKAFAMKSVPVLQAHLELAEKVLSQ